MEINPMNKQIAQLEAQQQQQLAAAEQQGTVPAIEGAVSPLEGALPPVEGAIQTPHTLAGQVKEVFGDDVKITDTSKAVGSDIDLIGSSPAGLVSSGTGTDSANSSAAAILTQAVSDDKKSP